MIRKDDLIMANKKDFTIEELVQAYEEAKTNCEALRTKIEQVKQEEEDRRKAELALEKESRKKEVDEALKHYNELLRAYLTDYGAYHSKEFSDDFAWYPNKFWRSFF